MKDFRFTPALLRSLLSLAVDLALVFLGWGLDDLRGYFTSPARAGVLVVILSHALYNLYNRTRPGPRAKPLEHVGLLRLQLMAVETVYVFAPFTDRRGLSPLPEGLRWPGLALFVLGTALMMWAYLRWPARMVMVDVITELDGEPAGVPQDPHDFLRGHGDDFRTGPFRLLRYPYFLGQVLLCAGMALAFASWTGLVIAALLLVLVAVRTSQLDEIYRKRFGAAWAGYSQGTWRLLPFVY